MARLVVNGPAVRHGVNGIGGVLADLAACDMAPCGAVDATLLDAVGSRTRRLSGRLEFLRLYRVTVLLSVKLPWVGSGGEGGPVLSVMDALLAGVIMPEDPSVFLA